MDGRSLKRVACIVCAAVLVCHEACASDPSPLRVAQLESVERHGAGVETPPPIPKLAKPQRESKVDTTGVWYYLGHRDLPRARAELERLEAANPTWRVPDNLTAAFENAEHPRPVSSAYQQRVNRAQEAIRHGTAINEATTGAIVARKDAVAAAALGRAYLDASDPTLARQWLDRAVAWSRPASKDQLAATIDLVKSEALLGQWDDARKAVNALPPGAPRLTAAHILSDSAAAAAVAAANANDWAKAKQLAALSELEGASRVQIDLGWAALAQSDANRAAAAFDSGPHTEEDRYGHVLALARLNDRAALAAACGDPARSERIAQACGDAFAERILQAYRGQKWRTVIDLEDQARALNLGRSSMRVLAGWSYYRLGDTAAALKAFDEASASEPDAADGIAQTLIAARQYGELAARAAASPELAADYHRFAGQMALIRHRTLLASNVDVPGTAGLSDPEVTVGSYVRDKSGAAGADRINLDGYTVSARKVTGTEAWRAGFEADRVRSGTPSAGAPIGSIGPQFTDHAATLVSPWAKWESESIDHALSVTLGTSPLGGAVGAVPTADLAGEWDWTRVIATGSLLIAPRYDSLLSMSGLRDAATNKTWGRVVEIGPQAGAIFLFSDRISASASVAVSSLDGHGIAGNSHVASALSLTYSIATPQFDYLRIGPAYNFDHYERNEFFFTLGNGGYYSPDTAHGVGGFVDFLTRQGRSWIVGGRLTASWQYSRQNAAARFPLADDDSRFAGIIQSQFGTDSSLRGALLLGPHLILGAFARYTYAPSGRDEAAGLTLAVPFAPRSGLFSIDLPHFADRSWP